MELLACSSIKTGLSLYGPNTEAKCKNFLEKMSLYLHENKTHFHIDSFALSLALKQRLGVTLNGLIDDNEHRAMIYSLKQTTRIKICCAALSLIQGAEGLLFHFTLSRLADQKLFYNTDKQKPPCQGPEGTPI